MNKISENLIYIILIFFMSICAVISIPYAFREGGISFIIPIIFIAGTIFINDIRKRAIK